MISGWRGRGWLEVVGTALPAVAILFLVGALYAYHREARDLSRRASALQQRADARALRSRLIGSELPDASFADLRGEWRPIRVAGVPLQVLWFVDPTSCVDCFGDLSGWRALGRHPGVESSLILVRVDRATARRVRQGVNLGETDVRWDGDGQATLELLGRRPRGATALVLGPDRRVLAAEVGGQESRCDWKAFARYAALLEVADDNESATGGTGETSPVHALTSAK